MSCCERLLVAKRIILDSSASLVGMISYFKNNDSVILFFSISIIHIQSFHFISNSLVTSVLLDCNNSANFSFRILNVFLILQQRIPHSDTNDGCVS